jgi:hypothetical protein
MRADVVDGSFCFLFFVFVSFRGIGLIIGDSISLYYDLQLGPLVICIVARHALTSSEREAVD